VESVSEVSGKKQLTLQIPNHSYLHDHRFQGRAVLPAVEAMQLLALSTRSQWPDLAVNCMRDGAFDKFLYMDDLAGPTAATVINEVEVEDVGVVHAKLLTRHRLKPAGISRLKQHVRLTFDPSGELSGVPPFHHPFELSGAVISISAERVYAELVPFGPAYQNIDGQLNLSEEGAVARLICPTGTDAAGQPLGSPFALDAAFHAACVWGQRYAGIVAFPVGFGERKVFASAQPGQRCLSRVVPLRSEGDPPVLFFDVWIFSEAGEPCETVRGLRMQDVSGGRWRPPPWVGKEPI
jgi:hypothetical protein